MDRHVDNVKRTHMHAACAFARRIPWLLMSMPVVGSVFTVQLCMSASAFVKHMLAYTTHAYVCWIARFVVHVARCIAGYENLLHTKTKCSPETNQKLTTAAISPAAHSMSIALHRIHIHITIFSKFFSKLPQGTYFLSVSGIYQYFDEL